MNVLVAIFSDTTAWTMPASYVDAMRRAFPDVLFNYADSVAGMEAHLTPQGPAPARRLLRHDGRRE